MIAFNRSRPFHRRRRDLDANQGRRFSAEPTLAGEPAQG
jgi:hypothetical protein